MAHPGLSFILFLGVMVETETLVRLHFVGRHLEFLFYVDQDRRAGNRAHHAGGFPCPLRAFVWDCSDPDSTRTIAADLQAMVPTFIAWDYQCSHSLLPDLVGRAIH